MPEAASIRTLGQRPVSFSVRLTSCERAGVSLVEVMVSIAIVLLLVGALLPAIQKVRETASRFTCSEHMRQIGLGLHNYHSSLRRLPPGVSSEKWRDPYHYASWQTRLLPYIEQDELWELTVIAFNNDRFFRNSPPHVGLATVIPLYTCPTDSRTLSPRNLGPDMGKDVVVAFTAYLGVSGAGRDRNDGVFYLDSETRFETVLDGLSNTVFVGERPPSADGNYGWWYGGWGQVKDGSCDCVLSTREVNVAPRYRGRCPRGPYAFGP
jgi:hypothetical protein